MQPVLEIPQALRLSLKGQLNYDRDWQRNGRLKEILDDKSTSQSRYTRLDPVFADLLNKLEQGNRLLLEEHVLFSPPVNPLPNSNKIQMEFQRINVLDSHDESLESALIRANKIEREIQEYEEHRHLNVEKHFNDKREKFAQHTADLSQIKMHTLNVQQGRRKLQQKLKVKELEDQEDQNQKASDRRQQKLKDDHLALAKQTDERLKEAAHKDQLEQEESMKRTLEFEQRITSFMNSKQNLHSIYLEIVELVKSCKNVQLLSSDVRQALQSANEIPGIITRVIEQIRNGKIDQHDVDLASSFQTTANSCLEIMRKEVESINKKLDEEERIHTNANVQDHLTAQPGSAGDDKKTIGLTSQIQESKVLTMNSKSAVKRYEGYMDLLNRVRESYAELAENATFKKYRFEISKSVNVPVNAISDQSGIHLRDKLDRLSSLLSGSPVETSDNRKISIKDHPQGPEYCLDLLAKKFVKQGEEQVSSGYKTAYPIAMVIVGLWNEYPSLGELLLAHFYAKCPYLVPYVPKEDGQSELELKAASGYNIEDGKLEDTNMFLKRMSGIVRLYAAIIQSPLSKGNSQSHPHGMENAWIWLARQLNLDPMPDITATVLFHFLDVCGHSLHQTYGKQFQKIVYFLFQEYIPRIRQITPEGSGGPVTKLENYFEKCLKDRRFPSPEGRLSQQFWYT